MLTTTRFDMRLDSGIKSRAEKAKAILGYKSLSEYVSRLIDEDASRVIEKHNSMVLENDVFDKFWDACNKSSEPNKALLNALKYTNAQGIK